MSTSKKVLKSLVPITQFNRGQASRIFERLLSEPQLIVLKNNQPSAVILSPEEYERLSEIEENYILLMEAAERLANMGEKPPQSFESVMSNLGINKQDLEGWENVEIEDKGL